jgi:thiosulfate dehydrogenase [quinone] large subunit
MASDSAAGVAADALASSRLNRALIALLRIGVGLLWIQNVGWKNPPSFGQGNSPSGLYAFTRYAVEYPVFPPYSWLVENLVLPNFTLFGWAVLLAESALGAFLLVGLATRFWAVVGIAQTVAITLSVLNAPNEWPWSYLLMLMAHAAVFATAAGRYAGLDGVLRSRWQASPTRLTRLLMRAS